MRYLSRSEGYFRLHTGIEAVQHMRRPTEPMKSLLDLSAAMVFIRLISAPTLLTKLLRKTTSLSMVRTRERRVLQAKQLLCGERVNYAETEGLTQLLNAPEPRRTGGRTLIGVHEGSSALKPRRRPHAAVSML